MSIKKQHLARLYSSVSAMVIVSSGAQLALAGEVPPPQAPSKKLMLVIVMTRTVGERKRDIDRVKEVFEKGVLAANANKKSGDPDFVEFLEPKEIILSCWFTREQLLNEIRRLFEVGPDTTLVFYYSAHGAISRVDEGDKGTPILMLDCYDPSITRENYVDQYVIKRADLIAVLHKRGARLTVLLTECCSDVVFGLTPKPEAFGPPQDQNVFRELFLLPAGFVDIISSRVVWDPSSGRLSGQGSFVPPEDGGLFTKAFHSILTQDKPKDRMDSDHDGVVSWDEFFAVLKTQTNENYQKFRERRLSKPWIQPALSDADQKAITEQRDQIPVALHPLPDPPLRVAKKAPLP